MEFYCDSVVNNNPNVNIISSIVVKPKSNHDCVDYSMDSLFQELFEGVDFNNLECNTQTIFEKAEQTDFLGITKTQSSFIDNSSSNISELTNNFPCEQTYDRYQIDDEKSFYDFFNNSDCDMDSQDSTNSFQGLDENSSTPSLQISSSSPIFSSDLNQSKIDEGFVISISDAEENSLAIQNLNVSYSERVVLDSKQIIDENSLPDLFGNTDFDLDSTNNFLQHDKNSTPSLEISSPSQFFSNDSNHSKIDEGLVISDSDAEENSLAIQNSNVSYTNRVILDSKFDTITQTPLSIREELDISEDSEDIPCGQRQNNKISHHSLDDTLNNTQDVTKKNFLGLDENSQQSLDFGSQVFSHFNICKNKINDELPISDSDDEVSATIKNFDFDFDLSYFDRPSKLLNIDASSRQANIRSFHTTETQTDKHIQNSTYTQTNLQSLNSIYTQTNKRIENSTYTQTHIQHFNSIQTQTKPILFKQTETNVHSDNSTQTKTNTTTPSNSDIFLFKNKLKIKINKHTQTENPFFSETNVYFGNSRQTKTNTNTTIQSNSSKLSDIFLSKNKLKINKQNLKSISKLKSLGYVLNNFYSKLEKYKPMLEEFDQDWERIGVCFKNVIDNSG